MKKIDDFEIQTGYNPMLVMEEASRCLLCYDAPCSKACPAQTDPAKFIRSIRFRNFKGAATTIRINNALGAVCARVCPTEKYCESGCSRSGIDKPINIAMIQRFATDFEESLDMEILKRENHNGKKVAIIGSGPSSLQAATTLSLLGYDVEIFEKDDKIGGFLRYGIPSYRLSSHTLDKEIERIKKLDVKFHLNHNVTKEELTRLEKEFDAIIVATGFSKAKSLYMFKDSNNVHLAIDFLKDVKENKILALPNQCLVIGGGDVAMDCNVSLKKLGVLNVTDVIYERRDEIRASKKEFEFAFLNGITLIDGYSILSVNGNRVTFKHRDFDNEINISSDYIILATGQEDNLNELGLSDLVKNKLETNFKVSNSNLFITGDLAEGDKTVVYAVKNGKAVAHEIDEYLRSK